MAEVAIPRLEGERVQAYTNRVAYLTMGPGRSLAKLLEQNRGIVGGVLNRDTLKRWSVRYNWDEHALLYDAQCAASATDALAVQHKKDRETLRSQYYQDLKAYYERYQKVGQDLYALAMCLMRSLDITVYGESAEDKDDTDYEIPHMEVTPVTLALVTSALAAAADVEAHALHVKGLLLQMIEEDDR